MAAEIGRAPVVRNARIRPAQVVRHNGAPISAHPRCPGCLHERAREQHFSCGAIEDIEQAIAIGLHDDLRHPLLQLHGGKHWNLGRIPVVQIVRVN